MIAKVGDIVRFLNDVGGGRVMRIENGIAYVDDDGFETPVMLRECVVVSSSAQPASKQAPLQQPVPQHQASTARPETAPHKNDDITETPEGDILNIVIGFEASDLKRLSSATFDGFIVNDSNYYLSVIVATRPNDSRQWVARYTGIIEPNMQEFMFELTREVLPQIDRVAVQYIAYKQGRDFELKSPVSVEMSFDPTKFAKLHCFRENTYFDVPVISLEITKNDVPNRPLSSISALKPKTDDIVRPTKNIGAKHKKADSESPLVVDLHITELLDSTAGLSNADMLNYQVDKFREIMDANLNNPGRKIVFIHGKGEGVLRQALIKELNHRYKGHDVQDASFREYGYGATQVTIRNIRR